MPKKRPIKPLPFKNLDDLPYLTKDQFASKLFELMSARGWNQSDLARRAGMNRDNISQYVRGRTYPTPKFLKKLAKALDMAPDALLPNYYADAVERSNPAFEYRELPSDEKYGWIRINKRVLRKNAPKIIELCNQTEGDFVA